MCVMSTFAIFIVYLLDSANGNEQSNIVRNSFTQHLLFHLQRNTRSIKEVLRIDNNFGLQIQWKFVMSYDTFTPLTGQIGIAYPLTIPFSILDEVPAFQPFFEKIKEEEKHRRNAREERRNIYQSLEDLLENFNIAGKACIMRTICEVSEIPFRDDFLGITLNTVFQASRAGRTEHPDEDHYYNNYIEAEMNGLKHGNCHQIYSNCSVSIFDLIPGMHHEIIYR